MVRPLKTRFAPSPTGELHLGHAYSAIFAYNKAKSSGGEFILRIEDIDQGRCRTEFTDRIYDDLAWLGLSWPQPVRVQSEHMGDYQAALDRLDGDGLLYPCFCTRNDILREIERSGHAPHGPDGHLYPQTCKSLSRDDIARKIDTNQPYALRLDVDKAYELACKKTKDIIWHDLEQGVQELTPHIFGDVVLARKDIKTSYHLSVTVDDHLQNINLVTRGKDLFEATHIHRLLQILLGLDRPNYHHHDLVVDEDGKRLAKRDKVRSIHQLRSEGWRVDDVYDTIVIQPLR